MVSAGADFAFRRDSSALVIVYRRAHLFLVADLLELRPSDGKPLKPSETVNQFAERMKLHSASYVVADGHYREAISEYLEAAQLAYVPAPAQPAIAFMRARALFRQGVVRLPNHPRLIQQLKDVVGKPLGGGGMAISQPRNSGGHGDLVSALVLALHNLGGDEIQEPAATGTKAWEEAQRELRRKACQEAESDKSRSWWNKGRRK